MRNISQKKLEFKTKEDQVYEILHDAILACDLTPGEKLVIDKLSDEIGISTIPIRAAIQRLGMEGLVDVRPHAPARVSEISLSMIKETFLLLAALEQVAFEAVAESADSADIAVMETLVKEMDDSLKNKDLILWAEQNIAFHRQIAESAGMQLLSEFTYRTFDQWRRLSNYYFKRVLGLGPRILQAQKEHWQIVSHIKNKEVEALILLAKHHNQAAFKSYQTLLQEKMEGNLA